MKAIGRSQSKHAPAFLILTGVCAGFLNGLLGAGGGILIVFALSRLFGGESEEQRNLYANALCVMLPISAFSCLRYALTGNLQITGFGVYALPAIVGGILGAFLLGRMSSVPLKRIFSVVVIYSGILMILR